MKDLFKLILGVLALLFTSRAKLEAEILILRQQINVLRRRAPKRPHLNNTDRFLFVWLYHWFPSVLGAIAIVRPETIIRWHTQRRDGGDGMRATRGVSVAAVSCPKGCAVHSASIAALQPITATSKRPNGVGSRPGFSRTSQLRVKLGIIRPPITTMSKTIAAMPMRAPYSAVPLDMGLDMKRDVAGEEQCDQTHDSEISPILAGNNLARGGCYDQYQKADINNRGQQPADLS
jgi:hypothetical protein